MIQADYTDYQLRKAAGIYWLVKVNQPDPAQYFGPVPLNEVGAFIWENMLQGERIPMIAKKLAEAFEVEETVALEDTVFFLQQLKQRGILCEE